MIFSGDRLSCFRQQSLGACRLSSPRLPTSCNSSRGSSGGSSSSDGSSSRARSSSNNRDSNIRGNSNSKVHSSIRGNSSSTSSIPFPFLAVARHCLLTSVQRPGFLGFPRFAQRTRMECWYACRTCSHISCYCCCVGYARLNPVSSYSHIA